MVEEKVLVLFGAPSRAYLRFEQPGNNTQHGARENVHINHKQNTALPSAILNTHAKGTYAVAGCAGWQWLTGRLPSMLGTTITQHNQQPACTMLL